jgi:cysteinyl-tRNA synthetase
LEIAQEGVRKALLDDFDTPKAIQYLLELVKDCNRYVEDNNISSIVLTNVARYVTSILRVFGLVNDSSEIGFPLESAGGGASKEQMLTPFLDILTNFRQSVRIAAINGDTKAVLAAADHLRDLILPDVGVRMEDKGSGKDVVTVWKLDDPEVLRKERSLKEEAKAAKEAQKAELAKKQAERDAKAKINPKDMFLSLTDLYSVFDNDGFPTHDKAGEPLSNAAIKKLKKEKEKQEESYSKYLAKEQSGN